MAKRNSQTSLAAINAKIAALQAQAAAIRRKEVGEVVARIREAIAHYGLTASDLGLSEPAIKTARRAKATRKSHAVRAGIKPVRPAKYKDAQGNSWSGMGKRPTWFKEALAAGKSADELLVKN